MRFVIEEDKKGYRCDIVDDEGSVVFTGAVSESREETEVIAKRVAFGQWPVELAL